VALLALNLALAVLPLRADQYLAPGEPNGLALLPPPPAADSPEQAADLELSRSVIKSRTHADEVKAMKDETLALMIFAPAIGNDFNATNYPKVAALYLKVKREVGDIINIPKDHYLRKRPYQIDASLLYGKPEGSSSYPSGHSTRGTLYSLILAEIFPEKRAAIEEMGRQIGWDRVLIGKHFLTDVRAGRMLGLAIFHDLMASPSFQHDLAEAKAEATAKAH
jgi:acid phosphatase (class A)